MKQKKQTAGNNKLLAGVKAVMNKQVFAHAAQLVNAGGEAAALSYLQQFFTAPVSEELFSELLRSGR
jgi:ABC-type enterochelin transport system substrate-binding protein